MHDITRLQKVFSGKIPTPLQRPPVLGRLEDLCRALRSQGISENDMDDETYRRLALLAWQSPHLSQLCLADATGLAQLVREDSLERGRSLREYQEFFTSILQREADDFDAGLRTLHRRELLRIAWRHILELADIDRLMRELSDLADCTITVVTRWAYMEAVSQWGEPESDRGSAPGFAVLGMGKLGGRELNFSSDIDLLFVYRGDGTTAGGRSGSVENTVFFERLATAICDRLSRPAAEGFLYRVDTRLRPQGTRGPLAPSLEAIETYYHNWGEDWERQALLKLRPVAGDAKLGQEVQRILTPFTYRKYVDEVEIAETLRTMNTVRRRMMKGLTAEELESDVKVGPGGIRDVEFIVQAVQMLYGGQYPEVRLAGTPQSLRRMHESGLLHSADYKEISDGYRFLRRVEHRLQIDQVRQTCRLPVSMEARQDLALRLGFDSYDHFQKHHQHVRQTIRRIYEGIFGRQEWEDQSEGLLDGGPLSGPHRRLLVDHGFTDPDRAHRNLLSLADSPAAPHLKAKTLRQFKALLPRLLLYLSNSPDPDMALNSLEQIIDRLGARTTLYGIMTENPRLVEMLVILTGGSRYLSELLLRDPSLVESLGRLETLNRHLDQSQLTGRLALIRQATEGQENNHEILVRFKNALELEIGLRYLLRMSDVRGLGTELAALAEFILQEVVCETAKQMRDRYPRSAAEAYENLGIVALGKLGGRELNFASDLDIIFLHEDTYLPTDLVWGEFFSRWAARICTFMSEPTSLGRLFECDPRLRPYGKSGTLSANLLTFEQYLRERAWVWERLALTRCRPVVGRDEWRRRFKRVWREALFSRPFTKSDQEEVVEMRFRIEREKGHAALKAGPGGLVDVEFIAQTIVLKFGREYEKLCAGSTPDILAAAAELGLLAHQDAQELRRSYLFLRDLENRLQIVNHSSVDSLPKDETDLDRLAKRCFPDESYARLSGAGLASEVESHTQRIRQTFRKFFNV